MSSQPNGTHPLANFANFDGNAKAPRWVIPGFIGHGVTVISGAQGAGKTTAMLPLALVAAGLHGGLLMPIHWRHVVYITEDIEQARRILAGIVNHGNIGITRESVQERIHIVEAVRLTPAFVAEVGKTYREQFTRTVGEVAVLPLVVLDTKSAVLAQLNENDNSEASAMMAALKQGFDGLPVWLIGHVAKPMLGRSDSAGLSSRGASALESDANQTLYLVQDGDARSLVQGKTRFEPRWSALAIASHTAETPATDEYGNTEIITMRWGIAVPATQSRTEAGKQAREMAKQMEALTLDQDIIKAVETAWQAGNPLNKEGVKAAAKRKASVVGNAIVALLSEGRLQEVDVPSNVRLHHRRSSFLISLSVDEHAAVLRGEGLPPAKMVIPSSWKKASVSSVPKPANQTSESEVTPDGN
jgi:hypothetical protein